MTGLAERVARRTLELRGYRQRAVPTSVGRVHALELERGGPLAPLVLLHGLSSAGVHFLPLIRHLHPSVSRLTVVDLPGHGFSDTPARLDGPSLRAGLFEALDQLLDGRPAVLLGNSLGGYAATRYTLARPTRVKGLVLVSPGGAALTDDELEALRFSFRLAHHDDALRFVDRLLARRHRVRRHLYAWGMRRQIRRSEVEAVLTAAPGETLLSAGELSAITPPVLFLWGKKERVLPARHLHFWRQHLPPHAEIREPEDWGHSPFLDDPAALAREVLDFARRLDAADRHTGPTP